MNGKTALFLVLGFSALFGIFGRNMLSNSNDSINNYSFYFNKTQANQVAKSGIFLALSNINSTGGTWAGGNFDFAGGNANVNVQSVGGPNGIRVVTSIGTYPSSGAMINTRVIDTIVTTLRQRSFSEYGNYYNKFIAPKRPPAVGFDNVWAATGDVFDGKFHANDFIRCYGNPLFKGEVTTTREIVIYDKYSHPEFEEGYLENKSQEIPTLNIATIDAASTSGKVFFDTTGANQFTDVYLKFYADGSVDYKSKIGGGTWSTVKNVPLTSLTSNGLIYIKGGKVTVEGVVNGQVTVVATKNGLTTADAGSVIIPNSIKYESDPLLDYGKSNPPYHCNDMLGLVAEKEVIVPFDLSRHNIDIQASIFAQDGGMKIERYWDYPAAYNMNIVGGVIGNYVEPTADYAWSAILKKYVPIRGYSYVHKYDSRFDFWAPPFFPKQRLFVPELWYTGNVIVPNMAD